jgi:hypothetical protein
MNEDLDEWIKSKVECCTCGGPIKNSKYINMVQTGRKATWKYPTAGNILLGKPCIEALSILCDKCISQRKKPLFAVEWDNEHTYVEYHPLAALEEL